MFFCFFFVFVVNTFLCFYSFFISSARKDYLKWTHFLIYCACFKLMLSLQLHLQQQQQQYLCFFFFFWYIFFFFFEQAHPPPPPTTRLLARHSLVARFAVDDVRNNSCFVVVVPKVQMLGNYRNKLITFTAATLCHSRRTDRQATKNKTKIGN